MSYTDSSKGRAAQCNICCYQKNGVSPTEIQSYHKVHFMTTNCMLNFAAIDIYQTLKDHKINYIAYIIALTLIRLGFLRVVFPGGGSI